MKFTDAIVAAILAASSASAAAIPKPDANAAAGPQQLPGQHLTDGGYAAYMNKPQPQPIVQQYDPEAQGQVNGPHKRDAEAAAAPKHTPGQHLTNGGYAQSQNTPQSQPVVQQYDPEAQGSTNSHGSQGAAGQCVNGKSNYPFCN